MILALSGKMRSGKDTAADVLVNRHGFTKLSFAGPLKEICAEAFGIPLNYFYDDDKKDKEFSSPITANAEHSRLLSDAIIERGCQVLAYDRAGVDGALIGQEFTTPRQLLQYVGTDVGREVIDDFIWINITTNLAKKIDGDVVIPDCRFENEVSAVQNVGGFVGLVNRPGLETNSNTASHASETSLNDEDIFDIVFTNDSTLPAFEEQVELWFKSRKNYDHLRRMK